jgi:hypothetical protein
MTNAHFDIGAGWAVSNRVLPSLSAHAFSLVSLAIIKSTPSSWFVVKTHLVVGSPSFDI